MSYYWDAQAIGKLLIHAAHCALSQQKNLQVYEKGDDKELFTNADVLVEKLCFQTLYDPKNNKYFLGEETVCECLKTTPIKEMLQHTMYVLDPIDGTMNYLNKLPNWAISLGLVVQGAFVEGAVILPELRELVISSDNAVYYSKFDQSFEKMYEYDTISFIKVENTQTHDYEKYSLFVNSGYSSKQPAGARNMAYHVNRSSVYSATKVMLGNYWGYASRAKLWDLAGCIGLFRNMNVPIYCDRNGEIDIMSYKVIEEYWVDFLFARYNIIFAKSKEHATKLLKST